MRIFTTFVIILCMILQISARGNQQMINGVPSDHQTFMVSIRNLIADSERFGSGHLCGGSILSFNLVVTAASCLVQNNVIMDQDEITIIAGTNMRFDPRNSIVVNPRVIFIHPNYSSIDNSNNIALIETRTMPLNFPRIQPVQITYEPPSPGDTCVIYGFGQQLTITGPLQLLFGFAQIVDRSACRDHRMNTICSSGMTSPCNGDTGGGLVCDGRIAGVIDHFDLNHCRHNQHNQHISYIDISPHQTWIEQHMRRVGMELDGEINENGGGKVSFVGVLMFAGVILNYLV